MSDPTYDSAVVPLDDFGALLCSLIKSLLLAAEIPFHSVDYRVKARDSAKRKLARGIDKYGSIVDLTDLLGVRVITYFAEEVDRVADVVRPEVLIDELNSVDKRAGLDPDRFGYLSLHYVAELGDERSKLIEYKQFAGRKFELQIRSILQHAWAEIEHDLGYKADKSLPRDLRRRFSRLAGLLELADDEFTRLRIDRDTYEEVVDSTVNSQGGNELALDQASLLAYIRTNKLVHQIDAYVASLFDASLTRRTDAKVARLEVDGLLWWGIRTLEDLDKSLNSNSDYIKTFSRHWIARRERNSDSRPGEITPGIALFYLQFVLAMRGSRERRLRWIDKSWSGVADLNTQLERVWSRVEAEVGNDQQFRHSS
jgi:putative GTP pyrophosphokinase